MFMANQQLEMEGCFQWLMFIAAVMYSHSQPLLFSSHARTALASGHPDPCRAAGLDPSSDPRDGCGAVGFTVHL